MFLFLSVSVVYGLPWKTLIRFYKFFDTRHPNVTCGRTAYSMSYPHRNAAHPCTHTHLRGHAHTHTHTYTHTHTHTHTHTRTRAHPHAHTHTYAQTHIHTQTKTNTHTHTHMVNISVCIVQNYTFTVKLVCILYNDVP